MVLRIVAVILACILWFTVNAPSPTSQAGQTAASVKDFPYAVQVNTQPDMMVTVIDHPTVVVEIRGGLLNNSSLPSEMMGVQVVADARGLGPGTHAVSLKAVGMPPVAYTILPQTVEVTLEKKVTASKPVQIHVTGTPAQGYQVAQVQPDVQAVQVSGVSSVVQRVAAVMADISVSGAKSTVSHTLTLEPVDKNGLPVSGVEVDPVNVTAVVRIEPPQMKVRLAPEVLGSPAPGYAVSGLSVGQQTVNVTASPDVTATLSQVTLPVDVSGLASTKTFTVPIVPGANWTQVVPSSVQVTVQISRSTARSFNGVPIQIRNIPQGATVTLSGTSNLDIRVSGPDSIISKLQTSNIMAYIDASGLTAGDTTADVHVSAPNWVTVTQLSQITVPVSVQSQGTANNNNNTTVGTNRIG